MKVSEYVPEFSVKDVKFALLSEHVGILRITLNTDIEVGVAVAPEFEDREVIGLNIYIHPSTDIDITIYLYIEPENETEKKLLQDAYFIYNDSYREEIEIVIVNYHAYDELLKKVDIPHN